MTCCCTTSFPQLQIVKKLKETNNSLEGKIDEIQRNDLISTSLPDCRVFEWPTVCKEREPSKMERSKFWKFFNNLCA